MHQLILNGVTCLQLDLQINQLRRIVYTDFDITVIREGGRMLSYIMCAVCVMYEKEDVHLVLINRANICHQLNSILC